jgi:hypothetical protein
VKSLYDFPDVFEVVMRRALGVVETEVRSVLELLARRAASAGVRWNDGGCTASTRGAT